MPTTTTDSTKRFDFLATARNLAVADEGLPLRFYDTVDLRSDAKRLDRILTTEVTAELGRVEVNRLRSGAYFHFDETNEVLPVQREHALKVGLRTIELFFFGMWLVRDHSCYPEVAFVIDRATRNGQIDYGFIGQTSTCADGVERETSFTLTELRDARSWLDRYLRHWLNHPSDGAHEQDTIASADTSRVVRVQFFLQGARASHDLGVKIAQTITCLEVLFSTSTAELTHKLSERVALFLQGTPEARIATFKLIRDAYKIRSAVVHGSHVGNKLKTQLASISEELADTLRRALKKILSDEKLLALFEGKPERIDTYFEELVFGAAPIDA